MKAREIEQIILDRNNSTTSEPGQYQYFTEDESLKVSKQQST